jgi:hypothetical protein
MLIKLDEIKETQSRRDHGDIKSLKQSIKEIGLINPLTVNQNYELLAGRRRYQAIKELGWESVECKMINTSIDNIWELDLEVIKNKCEICSYPFADLHHILPKQYGGTDSKSNLVYLCANHHRAIHFLIQLSLILETKSTKRFSKQNLEIQKYLILNDKLVMNFYEKYLKEEIINESNKRKNT